MKFNPDCRSCRRLTHYLKKVREKYPDFHCAPVDSFGPSESKLLIVGLAPGLHGANKTGRPFTGDASGELLFETLHKSGFASASESIAFDDGLELYDARITNAVRCLPPENKPTARELRLCGRYLKQDLSDLGGKGVIVALGKLAHDAVVRESGFPLSQFKFAHGAEHQISGDLVLIDSFHCSRYNTQTKRLTPSMFEAVFRRARELMEVSL